MKFTTEQESIDYFIKVLEKRGFTDIISTQSTNQYSYYDLEAKKSNNVYRFELKRRDMDVNTYNDHIMECYKLVHFIDDINNGIIKGGFLVSMFNDGIKVSNILKWSYKDLVKAPKTTDFNNNAVVDKSFVHYTDYKVLNYE